MAVELVTGQMLCNSCIYIRILSQSGTHLDIILGKVHAEHLFLFILQMSKDLAILQNKFTRITVDLLGASSLKKGTRNSCIVGANTISRKFFFLGMLFC